jgi:hypothetical protein
MFSKLKLIALLAVGAVSATSTFAQTNLFISQSGGSLGYGYGYSAWTTFTAKMDAELAARSGSLLTGLNVTSAANLNWSTSLMLDQRWTSGSLSATELTNLTSYIASGKRLLIIGENSAWTSWNQQILGLVGDTFAGESSSTVSPVGVSPITNGLGNITLPTAGIAAGNTGTALFNQNFARLYDNVLIVLDVNVWADNNIGNASNGLFADNAIDWLLDGATQPPIGAVPEPSTYGLIGAGALAGLIALRRRAAKSTK